MKMNEKKAKVIMGTAIILLWAPLVAMVLAASIRGFMLGQLLASVSFGIVTLISIAVAISIFVGERKFIEDEYEDVPRV